MTILENICGTLTQLSLPFPERSYKSQSSMRNSSYVFRNFRRYRRSRVCVVNWIVVRSLIRFATEISSNHSVMWTHSTMCCQYEAPAAPVAARITECEWNQGAGGEEIVLPTGSSDKLSARVGSSEGPLSSNLLAVVFEPELRRIGLPLVGSPNPALHLMLHPVERVDLDQRFVLSAFDAAVQARQAAVDRIAEDVREPLARPRPTGLRAVAVPVELLADLGDALTLEVTSENQRDHAGLLVLHLEHAVDVIVAVRTRVSQERVRLLHRVVECLRALQSSGPAQHLALVQVPFDAQFPKRLVLRLRRIVLKHLAG